MRRGTRVGEAYVAGTFDGSGMNEEIVDSVAEAGDGVEREGRRHGHRYGDSYGEALSERLKKAQGNLDKAFGSRLRRDAERAGGDAGDSAGLRMARDLGRRLQLSSPQVQARMESMLQGVRLDRSASRIGDRIGEKIADRMEEAIAMQAVAMENDAAGVSRNQSQRRGALSGRLYPNREPDDALRIRAIENDKAFDRRRNLMIDLAYRMNEEFNRRRGLMVDRARQMDEAHDRKRGLMVDAAHRLNEIFDRKRGIELDRAYRMDAEFDRKRSVLLDRAYTMNRRIDEKRGAEYTKMFGDLLRDRDKDAAQTQRLGRMQEQAIKQNRARDAKLFKAESDRIQRLGRMQEAALRMNAQFDEGGRDGRGAVIPGGRRRRPLMGDTIAPFLGAGSRNNTLNFAGRSIGNLLNLGQRLGRTMKGTFDIFMTGFRSAEQGASLLGKTMAGLGAVGARIGTSMMALVVAGPKIIATGLALIGVLSAIVSVASALLAIMAALAATITSAIAGALVVFAGQLTALVAAGGLVAVMFTSMTDAQREFLSANFSPLKEELTGLGQVMLAGFLPSIERISAALSRAINMLSPLAQVMGNAFGRVGEILANALSGPGFQQFTQAMTVWLPGIVTRLASAFGGWLNGMMSLFAAISPMIYQFSDYLGRVGERFAKWASSTEGQNTIADWVYRAVESLKSLWNFTREFFGWLGDILFSQAAQTAGNNMFDALANSFSNFRDAIADGSLERWFADAIDFGGKLWSMMSALGGIIGDLYSSGTLQAIGNLFAGMGQIMDALSPVIGGLANAIGLVLPAAIFAVVAPIQVLVAALITVWEAIKGLIDLYNVAARVTPGLPEVPNFGGGSMERVKDAWGAVGDSYENMKNSYTGNDIVSGGFDPKITNPFDDMKAPSFENPWANQPAPNLGGIGRDALNNTTTDRGGYREDKEPEYVNPYVDWANKLIRSVPSAAAMVKRAMRAMNADVRASIKDAAKAASLDELRSTLGSSIVGLRDMGKNSVESAQQTLENAATRLRDSTSADETARALAEVKAAQRALAEAQRNQQRLNWAANRLRNQRVVTSSNVRRLSSGMMAQNATLADYAAARERVAVRLEEANQRLTEAIALRDDYARAVADGARQFGSILTAQAQTINGVEQALTARDITSNLRNRLQEMRDFSNNMRKLLALGISNAAYKQLMDAGIETGGAYAAALVEGGVGAVSELNGLVSSIDKTAQQLGAASSNRLYQAGVDAAKGLVEGLESLSGRLDAAATRLGNSIANAVKRSLGIRSPSRVMMGMMDDVGAGAVLGLDNQIPSVSAAGQRLANAVAVSPEVAAYAASRGTAPTVSGNTYEVDIDIHTPTDNPHAVAVEAMNELTGRLP